MIAALYVEKGGVYYGLPDVDPWDEERDARLYAGPWPVVAHPPCNRWSLMAQCRGLRDGEGGGCFAAALPPPAFRDVLLDIARSASPPA